MRRDANTILYDHTGALLTRIGDALENARGLRAMAKVQGAALAVFCLTTTYLAFERVPAGNAVDAMQNSTGIILAILANIVGAIAWAGTTTLADISHRLHRAAAMELLPVRDDSDPRPWAARFLVAALRVLSIPFVPAGVIMLIASAFIDSGSGSASTILFIVFSVSCVILGPILWMSATAISHISKTISETCAAEPPARMDE